MKASRLHRAPWRDRGGLTLLELLMGLAVAGILATLAIAGYTAAVEKARVAQAVADIAEFGVVIERYQTQHGGGYPASLAEFNPGGRLDPWGNPYHYTLLAGTKGKGAARKDRRLNPLNSDYDLFSAGRNGVFKTQISQKDSLDDVIRARMGSYIGLAEDF